MIRQPAVAGQFYPASPEALAEEIGRCIQTQEEQVSALAVVSPHAGYLYSGPVAGAVFSQVKVPEQVIIVGVNHQGLGAGSAIMTEGAWAMPFGEVPIDGDLAEAILGRSRFLKDDARAHQHEHSLEVQVPFLQHFQPNLRIVPIALYLADTNVCHDVGEACAEVVRQAEGSVLIVASTDLSHESHNYERLKANDRVVIDKILALDPDGLLEDVAEHRVTMCGYGPTAAVIVAANRLGARESKLVRYADSYAVSGSTDYVVGYVGICIQ
jgi:AmmeMemoRadiSam system protein B